MNLLRFQDRKSIYKNQLYLNYALVMNNLKNKLRIHLQWHKKEMLQNNSWKELQIYSETTKKLLKETKDHINEKTSHVYGSEGIILAILLKLIYSSDFQSVCHDNF